MVDLCGGCWGHVFCTLHICLNAKRVTGHALIPGAEHLRAFLDAAQKNLYGIVPLESNHGGTLPDSPN